MAIGEKPSLTNSISTGGGGAYLEFAATLGCSQRCIQKTLARWGTYSSNLSRSCAGRPPILIRWPRRQLLRLAREYSKIEYQQLMEEADLWPSTSAHPPVAKKTVYWALIAQGLKNFGLRPRPNINRSTALKRLSYSRNWRYFHYKRVTVKFSDECSLARVSGENQEWSFQFPDEKFDRNKLYESTSPQPKHQMVWGSI